MIPVALVTGFLGSGKTTFLQRLVDRYRDRRLVYLVNEFSPTDVDTRLLACDRDNRVSVPGGSIFCQCLVTEFIRHLTAIAQREDLEGVVVEASGIADPRVFARMLNETRLDRHYRLARIATILDPGTFPTLLQTLPNIRSQVEASDVALLNKVDLYPEQQLRKTESIARELKPSLVIVRTENCRTELDPFAEAPAHEPGGQYAACADPNFLRATVVFEGAVDLDRLIREIDAARSILYRVKGFVLAGDKPTYVDATYTRITVKPAESAPTPSQLVFIGRGDAQEEFSCLLPKVRAAGVG
jgi:G3E family GTPase